MRDSFPQSLLIAPVNHNGVKFWILTTDRRFLKVHRAITPALQNSVISVHPCVRLIVFITLVMLPSDVTGTIWAAFGTVSRLDCLVRHLFFPYLEIRPQIHTHTTGCPQPRSASGSRPRRANPQRADRPFRGKNMFLLCPASPVLPEPWTPMTATRPPVNPSRYPPPVPLLGFLSVSSYDTYAA